MRLNADFSQRVVIGPGQYQWVDSPVAGVERMMLDRIGDEVARATSLVRYAPDSTFPAHVHGGGEEILVLEGAFGDEHGLYPAGSYLRNPVGSRHTPRVGPAGSTIFVKLHQFDPGDQAQFVLDTRNANWQPGPAPGCDTLRLHSFGTEQVKLLKLAADAHLPARDCPGGEEILVMEGHCADESGDYAAGSWVRSPPGSRPALHASLEGALLYVKTGHLDSRNSATASPGDS